VTRVLITGVSGLLGSNLALEAAKRYDVVGVWSANPLHSTHFATMQANLLVPEEMRRALDESRADWLINCAALANLDSCEREPELAQQLNAQMPGRLAAEALKRGMRFMQISTDAVFDGSKDIYREENTPSPVNVYGRTKRLAELATKSAHPGTIIVRTNLFGWSIQGDRSLAEFFYNNLSRGNKVNGYSDRLFCPLLATDLANILLDLLEADQPGIYHAVSSDSISKYEFGVAIAKRFGFDPELVQPADTPVDLDLAPRSANLVLSNAKAAKTIGRRLPTVANGIDGFFAQFEAGYRDILKQLSLEAIKE
jgi:dTDP-4-dehydrorhamnose reductase